MTSATRAGAGLLLLAYLGFISLGLPDATAGVAWPFARRDLGAERGALGVVLLAAGGGYVVAALLAGRLLQRFGVGGVTAGSTALVALGLASFAAAPSWAAFLAAAPLIGLGSGAIDAGLNHFAARHFSARHMAWLHGCYGIGATAGPALLTLLFTHGATWRQGYAALAALQGLAALAFAARRRALEEDEAAAGAAAPPPASAREALASATVRLQVAIFLVYAGLEVTISQWSFPVQLEGEGAGVGAAGAGTSLYWGSLTLGRFAAGALADRVGPVALVRLATLGALAGCAGFALGGAGAKIASLAVIGLSVAPIYPSLMAETPRRVGAGLAAHAVGWQVGAAMAGALLLPSAVGALAQALGLGAIGPFAAAVALALVVLHERLVRGGG